MITRNSIEIKIASGLGLKQNLFDGVLSDDGIDEVDFSASGRAQFLDELKGMLENLSEEKPEMEKEFLESDSRQEKDTIEELIEEESEDEKASAQISEEPSSEKSGKDNESSQTEAMENTLNHGMDFLSGLLKMATGKDADFKDKKVEDNPETREVIMRFKLPSM